MSTPPSAESYEISSRQEVEASQIADLYDSLLGETDIRKVLQRTTEVAMRLMNAERATIYFLLEETRELESAVVIGNVVRAIRIPISPRSLAGFCATSRRAFVIDDAYDDLGYIDPGLRFDKSWDEANGFRTRSVACAPILFRGELLGVAQVINSAEGRFDRERLDLLESMCRFAGYALYYARVCDELASVKRLEKEKAEFMRVLVHELKSPVSASKTLASSLKFVNEDNPIVTDAMTKIEKRMDQLLELVGDVLNLSRIKQGDPIGAIDVFDVAADTQRAAQSYEPMAAAKNLAFRVDLPGEPIRVRIDSKAYHLIVSNLLSNAIKYTGEGAVSLALAEEGGYAVLKVGDTGMGIPAADVPHLFREFFRASNARRNGVAGTGVGLAGIKNLVERFRGVMELETEENRGSTFIVRLPVHTDAP